MKSEVGVDNILECRHVGQYDNYMALEEYCDRLHSKEIEFLFQLNELGLGVSNNDTNR